MTEIYTKDGQEYTASNRRIRYDPELHDRHGKPFTVNELAFMCASWGAMKKADIAAALGRTHNTVLSKAYVLRCNGQFDHYARLGKNSR